MTLPSRSRALARRIVQRGAYFAIGGVGLALRLCAAKRGCDGAGTRPARAAGTRDEPQRILVVRLDLLGDVLFTLPLVEGLRARFPRARIVMLTLPYTAALARLSPAVDRVAEIDTNRIRRLSGLLDPRTWIGYRQVVRELRAERFDLAISAYGQMGSLWAALSGAARTAGYTGEAYPFLLSHPLRGGRHVERKHEVEYIRRLGLHVDAPVPARLSMALPAAARQGAQALLSRHGIGEEERIVAIHAGAVNGSAKRWPPQYWSAFADAVQTRAHVRVVLLGAKADAPLAARVAEGARLPVVSLAGETDLIELIGILARADLVASGDSGPLHLAVALGRPLVAAYGPTDPAIYGPYNPSAPVRMHRADLPCSPCYTLASSAECPLGDPICMRLVSVGMMVESALELLGSREDQLAVAKQHTLQDTE